MINDIFDPHLLKSAIILQVTQFILTKGNKQESTRRFPVSRVIRIQSFIVRIILRVCCVVLFLSVISVQKFFLSFVIVSPPCTKVMYLWVVLVSHSQLYYSSFVVIQSFLLFSFFRELRHQHHSCEQHTNINSKSIEKKLSRVKGLHSQSFFLH